MEGLGSIIAAAIAFVGAHLLLSHPLRQPIAGVVGNAAFLGICSAVAAATLAWLALVLVRHQHHYIAACRRGIPPYMRAVRGHELPPGRAPLFAP
jgi:NnrU protein